jgi:adenylate cyclase
MSDAAQDRAVSDAALSLIEWLVSDGCGELDDAELLAELGTRLNALAIPVDRLTLHLRTLHPDIFARTIAWAPGEAVEIRDRGYGVLTAKIFVASPLRKVMETGQRTIARVDAHAPEPWLAIDVFKDRQLVEFVMAPLVSASGPDSAVCFATRSTRGFPPRDVAVMDRFAPALRTVCELRSLQRAERDVLARHRGRAAG